MSERWYVTFELAEHEDDGYTATERDRDRIEHGDTPIRALINYAASVEQALDACPEPAPSAANQSAQERDPSRKTPSGVQ